MPRDISFLFFLFILPAFLMACEEGKSVEKGASLSSIKSVPQSAWNELAQKKIYFGHQSVGYNIIDGIKDVMKDHPQIKLNIVETDKSADFVHPLFGHSRVGKNRKPFLKIKSFAENIESGIGNKVDFAFFKFCYVDFPPDKPCKDIFNEYKATMSQLRQKFPKTIFVHITVPLVAHRDGFVKAWVKKILGKSPRTYSDNVMRHEMNLMMRQEYEGKEPLFDLARTESTLPDGTRTYFKENGKKIPALILQYTNDGSHLNMYGRKIVAEQFLIYLAGYLE